MGPVRPRQFIHTSRVRSMVNRNIKAIMMIMYRSILRGVYFLYYNSYAGVDDYT